MNNCFGKIQIPAVRNLQNTLQGGSPGCESKLFREEILKLIAPSEEVQTSIIDWIQNAADEVNLKAIIKNMKDSIHVTAPGMTMQPLEPTLSSTHQSSFQNRDACFHQLENSSSCFQASRGLKCSNYTCPSYRSKISHQPH